MSVWTYVRAIIEVTGFSCEYGCKEDKRDFNHTFMSLFDSKIYGSEGAASITCKLNDYYDMGYMDEEGNWVNYITKGYVFITGNLRDREVDDIVRYIKTIMEEMKESGYWVNWDMSAGTIFDDLGGKVDVRELMTEIWEDNS